MWFFKEVQTLSRCSAVVVMKHITRIGITLDLANNDGTYCYAAKPWYALRKCYADAVIAAGGLVVMLPYQKNIEALLDNIDGLILSGGDGDIPPEFYGQDSISERVKPNKERALFELPLLKAALERDMPVLGICNGMQAINVALGGNLIQHIPDVINAGVVHEQPAPKDRPSHIIHIEDGTKLFDLAKRATDVMVNSTHHQAIGDLGRDLMISARADDGIIEAIESRSHAWVIGVQWHCEYLNSTLEKNLFIGLIDQARKSYGQGKTSEYINRI